MNRQVAALVAVLAVVLTAGCTGLVFGDGAEFDAEPAAVDEAVLDETGYEHQDTESIEIEETEEVAGQERTISVTNWVVTYESGLELQGEHQESTAFVVATTPDVSIAGQRLNPVADFDNEELLSEFGDELEGDYGELRDVRVVDERVEPVLGKEATVTTFAAETEIDGEELTINIHVTQVVNDDDIVIAIGAHPEVFQQEGPNVHALMRGIEHPQEP